MAVIDRTPTIRISPDSDAYTSLIRRLEDMIEQADEFHSEWSKYHAEYWRLYRTKPVQEVRSWPWNNASNVVVPLTRVSVDSTAAMVFDAMFSTMPEVTGRGAEDEERASLLSQFYFSFLWDSVLNLKQLGNDWNLDTMIDGTGVVKPMLDREFYVDRQQIITPEVQTESQSITILGREINDQVPTGIIDQIVTEESEIKRESHPRIEVVDLQRLKVAPGSGPSLQYPDCPWYFEETYWTSADIHSRKSLGWDHLDEALNFLQPPPITDKDKISDKQEGLNDKRPDSLEVKVFYMRYALPGEIKLPNGETRNQIAGEGYEEDVIVWYLPQIRQISRMIPLSRVRPDGQRPHIDNRWTRIPRYFYGIGIPAALRQMNDLMSSAFNQMTDYGTLRNVPWGLYSPALMGNNLPENFRLEPGAMIPVNDPRGVNFPSFSGDNTHWLQLLQQAQAFSERLTSVTDFTVGRAPSTPNAPRTARGQAALMQQSQIAFSYRVAQMVESYRQLFRSVHVIYQKHAPKSLDFRYFNRASGLFETKKITRDDFRTDVDFEFRLNPNRMQKQQELQMITQLLSPVLLQMQNINGLRALYKQTYDSFGLKNFETIWPEQPPVQVGQPGMGQPGMGQPPGMPPQMPGQAGMGQSGTDQFGPPPEDEEIDIDPEVSFE